MNKNDVNKQVVEEEDTPVNPRNSMIAFLRKSVLDEPFEFIIPANDVSDANKYIHNMRCALTRLRSQAVSAGRRRRAFKIITKSIEAVGKGEFKIVWVKCYERAVELDDDILNYISS